MNEQGPTSPKCTTTDSGEPRRVVDQESIRAALHRCGDALDRGEEAVFVDCFTEDGFLVIEQRDGPAGGAVSWRVTGHTELASWAAGHTCSPLSRHKHTLTSLDVAFVDQDTADARSYVVRHDVRDGVPHVHAFGRYRDRLTRCADGGWRFVSRTVQIEARSDIPLPQLTEP